MILLIAKKVFMMVKYQNISVTSAGIMFTFIVHVSLYELIRLRN